jgi:hypothetical protein
MIVRLRSSSLDLSVLWVLDAARQVSMSLQPCGADRDNSEVGMLPEHPSISIAAYPTVARRFDEVVN